MGGGIMELEIVELPEDQDEIVLDRLQLRLLPAEARLLGLHKVFHPSCRTIAQEGAPAK
jgi:Mg2+/Co2+ transporter CorC